MLDLFWIPFTVGITRFHLNYHSRIYVVAMTGATIVIDDAFAADTILSVKQRVFVLNRKMHVLRQRLMYRPGPRGINPLADDETLLGVGVAQDGTAELDVLLVDLTAAEVAKLGPQVRTMKRHAVNAKFEIKNRVDSSIIFVPYLDKQSLVLLDAIADQMIGRGSLFGR